MRINKYIAGVSGLSRRAVDVLLTQGAISVNGTLPVLGQSVTEADHITIHGKAIEAPNTTVATILLHKPTGFVCSRNGQGSKTIYELIPAALAHLKPIGRLDKDSSGLLLMTSDGDLLHKLSHPRYEKQKVYQVTLVHSLLEVDEAKLAKGVLLNDGLSKLQLSELGNSRYNWQVTMHEGRNRQIRRSFEAVHNKVIRLHRVQFGDYSLGDLAPGRFIVK